MMKEGAMRQWRRAFGVAVAIGIIPVTVVRAEDGAKPAASDAAPKSAEPSAANIVDNMSVQLEYVLSADGKVVDTTEGRGPFTYVHGQGQIIPGLERQLAGLTVGSEKEITVAPEEGYGPVDPAAFIDVPREQLPSAVPPEQGLVLQGMDESGQSFQATVHEIKDKMVTLNLNHPLAGKTLLFKIKVLSVAPATR